jgi:hypothetical protein
MSVALTESTGVLGAAAQKFADATSTGLAIATA